MDEIIILGIASDAKKIGEENTAAIDAIKGGMRYKGEVANYASLPATGNKSGDIWKTTDTGKKYIWGKVSGVDQWELWDEPSKDIFECTYGTTTYAEITQALSDGKLPVCIYSDRFYKYDLKSPTDRYIFNASYADALYSLNIQSNDTWGAGNYQFEITSNKVTSISSSSTNAQFPSAKAVYDSLLNVIDATSDPSLLPSSANTSGIMKFVLCSSEPATKYNGYLYLITGA